ncbi:MAG: hypothetical protein BroJett042_16090 [Bacteroidota bacterium]|nr:MAG: hypothetical protein BroJett042_16090 [Bacteroidota bacterium]
MKNLLEIKVFTILTPKITGLFQVILISLSGSYSANCQSLNISIVPEYATYKMSELKKFQSQQAAIVLDSLLTNPKVMYDFPSYWGLSLNSSYSFSKHSYHLNLGYNVTGGRLHYSDYSGLIKIDKQVKSNHLSAAYSYSIVSAEHFQIKTGIALGVSFSSLRAYDNVEIYVSDEVVNESNKYHSKQLFVNPDIAFYLLPLKNIFLQMRIGYLQQIHSSGQKNEVPHPNDNIPSSLKLDWSGFRIGAGIGYKFNLKK